ncbi:MAG TPA: Gfo/Idh/MocA family oxidoreductase [Streptosporangiaceae bacterium]|nr:Gfo/Idh/MocA family oxidoreductase [Streptosporangiaceae bacterium]
MDQLRIGVLGTAQISTTALLGPAASVPEVTVAAVAARDPSRAEAYARQHGIPGAYGSYEALLADPGIDAVYNPLPNSLHGPWTMRAIAAGKHVLCEKPLTSNAEEAEQVAEAAEASGLVVMEAMHYRYHPLIRRLREVVGELGPVRLIQCWTSFVISDESDIRYDYDLGGGALMDGGCYALDCLRLLGPGEPDVTAALADPYQPFPGWVPDRPGAAADRAMAVRLAFPGDATGWFESSFTLDGEFRADVHVSCQHGHVWMQDFIRAHWGHLVAVRNGSVLADERGSGDSTYTEQLRAFATAIADGTPVPTSAAHAVTTMRLIDDAYRAAGLLPRGD